MKLDRLLSPMLKIGETFNVNLDVRFDDHTHLGYQITITAHNAEAFFKHFGDKNFCDKWDEVTLWEILLHKPFMSPCDRSLEIGKKLKQVVAKLVKAAPDKE